MTEDSTSRLCDCGYMFGKWNVCTKCGKSHPVWGKPLILVTPHEEFCPMAHHLFFATALNNRRGPSATMVDLMSAGF